jgi:PAS domain-containing protein
MLTPFEVIFANIAQGIALLDSDLRVLVVNNRLSQLLQIPELTMVADAKAIADHLPACNQTRLWLTHLVTEQKSLQQEIEVGGVLL